MNPLARGAVLVGLVTLGCSSSSTTKHHLLESNTTGTDVFMGYALSNDDTTDWDTFRKSHTVSYTVVSPGQTQSSSLPATGHYRWGYYSDVPIPSADMPTLTFIADSAFDVVDENSDIHMAATDGTASSGDDGGTIDNPPPTCTPTGRPCTREHDYCCNGECFTASLTCN